MRTDNAASSERKQNHAYERQRLQKETKSHARTEDTAQKKMETKSHARPEVISPTIGRQCICA